MTRWLGIALALLLLQGVAFAGEADEGIKTDDLVRIIQQQNEKLDTLMSRVKQLEESQTAVRSAIADGFQRTESLASKMDSMAVSDIAKWAAKTRVFGDFRYRHEFFDIEDRDRERNRHRIRVRIGFASSPCDDLDFVVRLATGSEDPVSTNQTIGDHFSTKDIRLDQAYFDWHPGILFGVHILGGKMKNPFFRAGKSQLIFDSDLTPEGLALKYSFRPIEITKIFAGGGGFWIAENASGRDQLLYGAQMGVEQGIGDYVKVTIGTSYYDFGDTKGKAVYGDGTDPFGNTAVDLNAPVDTDGDGVARVPRVFEDLYYDDSTGTDKRIWRYADPALVYLDDYQLLEAFTQVDIQAGPIPVSVYTDYVQNVGAETSSEDQAWLTGVKVGKAKRAGSWEVGYNYRRVQADAVIGAFSDSDFIGGGTDGKGHCVHAAYMLTRCAKLAVTYFQNYRGMSAPEGVTLDEWKNDYRRLQVDFLFGF